MVKSNPQPSRSPAQSGAISGQITQVGKLIAAAKTILVWQPDQPDGDSLACALGLEEILGDLGKTVTLFSYRAVDEYLRILEGWDRVSQEFPDTFDLSILIDAASPDQIYATLEHHAAALATRPLMVIDHHATRTDIPAALSLVDPSAAAAAELITTIALELKWPLSVAAAHKLANGILSDTLNLSTPATTPLTVRRLADLVERGANLYQLHLAKREAGALIPELLALKGQLLQKIDYVADGRLAVAIIDQDTINHYRHLHDPADLIIWEMQWVKGVEVAAVIRDYGKKLKVSLRAKRPVAHTLAAQFGGGGHPGAAAFKPEGTDVAATKAALIAAFIKLGPNDATV